MPKTCAPGGAGGAQAGAAVLEGERARRGGAERRPSPPGRGRGRASARAHSSPMTSVGRRAARPAAASMASALRRGALVTTAVPMPFGLGPVEEGVDAGERLDAGGERCRGTSPPCGRGWRRVLAGEVAAEDVGVGVAHDVGAVLGEAEVAAALGQDRDEGGVVQVVGVDQRAVEVEEQRGPASCPGAAGARGDGAGVVGGGGDAAEREEVDARRWRSRGAPPCGRRASARTRSGSKGSMSLREVGGAALQHAHARRRRRRTWRT